MKSTQDRELAGPPLAERARTLATRSRTATVVAAGATDRPMPILYQAHRDRTAVLLLAMDRALPTLAEVAPGGEVSAMLELSDVAPVTMREPVRGLLWITGWLRALSRNQARRASARWAEQRPDSRLLDVGHTANLLWLDPVFAMFSDGEGSGRLHPAALADAEPDPFCRLEYAWLRHLEQYPSDVLRSVVQRLPGARLRCGVQVRPLGIDRLGLRLRIEDADRAHDMRLAFHCPATTPVRLASELYGLLGSPAAAQNTR
jgi:hypothetical protein